MERPEPTVEKPQHLCLDKGYRGQACADVIAQAGYIAHIRRIGEEKLDERQEKKRPARRWVVERTFAWLSRCRAILVRHDKLAERYLALIKVDAILLWFRRWHQLDPTFDF